MANVTGSGTPNGSCGTPSSIYTCNVSGVGKGGSVTFNVAFVNVSGTPTGYSPQSSTINETGNNNTGSVTSRG